MELDAQARQDDSVVDPDAHPDDGADKRNHDHDGVPFEQASSTDVRKELTMWKETFNL